MSANPNLVGPVSPTPTEVYEPRFWSARIWLPEASLVRLNPSRRRVVRLAGIGFFFKAPYGQAMNAATVLSRACSRRQILRFTFGPMSKRQRVGLDRSLLRRFEETMDTIAHEWALDWSA